jgi:hypothetical protein
VFPPSNNNSKDPILAKKLQKGDGTIKSKKCILGFNFDSNSKTIWLEGEKRATLSYINGSEELQNQNKESCLHNWNP